MNILDITIIIVYSVGLLGLGYFFKGQEDEKDYFLGGRSFGWFELGLSTMATQLSAISFISASAFVGLRQGGGMQWLTFEFAVPLAMIFLMVTLIPPLYNAGIISIYQFLENRFSGSTRVLISIVFQFSRAFGTGILIYAVALVLSTVLGIAMWQTILLAGVVTVIYSFQGGMKAVVWGDAIQMIILFLGILVCIGYGLYYLGGWGEFVTLVDRSRLEVIDFSNLGFGEGEEFGFWPMLIGGFFLYISYYGTDQSQAQRSLSARDLKTMRNSLLFNGLMRFPITFCYCIMGLIVGTFAFNNPEFLSKTAENPDLMMPIFIADYLPNGIIGLLIVAILAAAMSSLSSAVNSLSAASVEDLIVRNRKEPLPVKKQLLYSKMMTIFWGTVCIILAFSAGNIAKTIVEAINKIGSVFYGPVLAVFVLAIMSKKAHAKAVNIGLLAGVALNLFLWQFVPDLFWLWWNFTGAVTTFAVGYGLSLVLKSKSAKQDLLDLEPVSYRIKETYILIGFFVLIIGFSLILVTLF